MALKRRHSHPPKKIPRCLCLALLTRPRSVVGQVGKLDPAREAAIAREEAAEAEALEQGYAAAFDEEEARVTARFEHDTAAAKEAMAEAAAQVWGGVRPCGVHLSLLCWALLEDR